jgi:SAM-dependent methyltransferase
MMPCPDQSEPRTGATGSAYSDLDRRALDPREYVHRLDQMWRVRAWRDLKRQSYRLLDLQPGHHVLDIGCGTGDDVRALAQLILPSGLAIGVDRSSLMIDEARARAADRGLPVDFHIGDASRLEFAESVFDGCRAERVLQHLDDPRQALSEMVRVSRLGGRVVVVEPDYGTLSVEGADRALTRKILAHRVEHFRSATLGRRLPRLFSDLGLAAVGLVITTIATTDLAHGRERRIVRRYAENAVDDGVISTDEAESWLMQLATSALSGRYRHATSVFLVSGRKS